MFHSFLSENIRSDSKILLMCCVSPLASHLPSTLIALDYCQKIKCYFNGISDENIISKMLKENSNNSEITEDYKIVLGQIFSNYSTF
jgi:hypothetical protein